MAKNPIVLDLNAGADERKITLAALSRQVEANDAIFQAARSANKALRECVADQIEELLKLDRHAAATFSGRAKRGRRAS